MLVVTAIFMIMTATVLANLPSFRQKSSLELVAQEVALVVRQAQAYGSITRVANLGSSSAFPSYGIYFNLDSSGETAGPYNDQGFIFFADRDTDPDVPGSGNNTYDPAGGCGKDDTECRESFTLNGTIRLVNPFQLCSGGDEESCVDTKTLNIVFDRPNPEAIFTTDSGDLACESCSYAKIGLISGDNQCADVYVWNTGHIYSQLKDSCTKK
jgi:type II secretory pathway pseudopilin PulG